MSRPRTAPMLPPIHDDACCPRCRHALVFDTDRAGNLVESCPYCETEARRLALLVRRQLPLTVQRHRAFGLCTHTEGLAVCELRQASAASNACQKYCGAHCKAHRHDHDCPRGRKREYMRDFMAQRYRESRERTKALEVIA